MSRRSILLFVALSTLMASALVSAGCGGTGGQTVDKDSVVDTEDSAGIDTVNKDSALPGETTEKELPGDLGGETFDECVPGTGCFGEPCKVGSDCLSGYCVDHMGDLRCSKQCVEECPAGWTCQQIGTGGPDVAWVCISDFRVLCRPCVDAKDCSTGTGQEDLCVEYGPLGKFCGGACGNGKSCPAGYDCEELTTDAGSKTWQCVSESGECECSQKSKELGLATVCKVENEFGVCEGPRVCTQDGLSPCTATAPKAETCNGVDDDCDGQTDESMESDGKLVSPCDDGNECTKDICNGKDGCAYQPLSSGNCDDGNACTLTDHCENGKCVGTLITCNDSNPCTDDSCDGVSGCVFTPNDAACDDNDPCTIGDKCIEGKCTGFAVDCACQKDSDCAKYEDGDLCNGTLYCDKSGIEFQCKLKPDSVVVCPEPPAGKDAFCQVGVCDPKTGKCGYMPTQEGLPCNDGDFCTFGETCQKGKCLGGQAVNCNDANPCTKDSCEPKVGCQYAEITGECSDGNACTFPDVCAQGVCISGPAVDCNDNNPCTQDQCNPLKGCVYTPTNAGCDDGNACTTGDQCVGGFCKPTGTLNCDDKNPCTDDFCSPVGGCQNVFNSASCSDSNMCTVDDQCQGGVCVPGKALNCNDSNPCTDDTCSPFAGCVYTNNKKGCDDKDPCTLSDVCSGGLCVGTGLEDCDDKNPCTDDVCIPMAGCTHINNSNPCSDGNACTLNDVCALGICTSSGKLVCNDNNVCTDDSCDIKTGCVFTPNNAQCDDLNSCTTGDKCVQGVCMGTGTADCDDKNPCTKDICLPNGGCKYENASGAPCTDGDPCTAGDVCEAGVCVPGTPIVCNDSNPCTDDVCQSGKCVYTPNQAACDDGNPCTTGDYCSVGKCLPKEPLDCDDGNPCTTDYCHPVDGCQHVNNTIACSDSNACTLGDKCEAGKCVGAVDVVCDDFNPCTDDSCDPIVGCVYKPNSVECDDGNECTVGDTCKLGKCVPSGMLTCDDGNECTTDHCDFQLGCVFDLNGHTCDDGDACTTGDKCSEGLCMGTGTLLCDDANDCTDDSCLPESGCKFTPNEDACDDGNKCTNGDVCKNASCVPGPPLVCNDNNSCTTDSCDPKTGCKFVNKEDNTPCDDDGDPCTTDLCKNGECTHSGTGWSGYGNKCYKYFTSAKNWDSARADCVANGGDLASIGNSAENDFVHSLVEANNAPWIGFNDISVEGQWKWSDNSAVTYVNWHSGEPNNSGNEDCGHLYKYPGQPYDKKWNDAQCGSGYPFVCEK